METVEKLMMASVASGMRQVNSKITDVKPTLNNAKTNELINRLSASMGEGGKNIPPSPHPNIPYVNMPMRGVPIDGEVVPQMSIDQLTQEIGATSAPTSTVTQPNPRPDNDENQLLFEFAREVSSIKEACNNVIEILDEIKTLNSSIKDLIKILQPPTLSNKITIPHYPQIFNRDDGDIPSQTLEIGEDISEDELQELIDDAPSVDPSSVDGYEMK